MSEKEKEFEKRIKKLEERVISLERKWTAHIEREKWERIEEVFAPILEMASPEIREAFKRIPFNKAIKELHEKIDELRKMIEKLNAS